MHNGGEFFKPGADSNIIHSDTPGAAFFLPVLEVLMRA
jgi:hypothetical protein